MKRKDIEKVCWHILENCMVIHNGQVVSQDYEQLRHIVEKSIEEFDAMENTIDK